MSECVVRMDIDEMPTACGPCKLSCTAICKEWTKVDRKEIGRTKSPNCPIIAILPECHGRLADKDLLMQDLDFLNTFGTPDDGKELSYEDILVTIDDFPTIVPAAPKEENQDDGN